MGNDPLWELEWTNWGKNALMTTQPPPAAPETPPDPRDPDYSREGIFQYHNCWKCSDGRKPCIKGQPRNCEHPHARND